MVLRRTIDSLACAGALFDICLRASIIARTGVPPRPLSRPPPASTKPTYATSTPPSSPATSKEAATEQPKRHEPALQQTSFEPIKTPTALEDIPVDLPPTAKPLESRATASEPLDVPAELPEPKLPVELDTFVQESPVPSTTGNISYSAVPSTRIGRLFHYGGLATDISFGAASEALRRATRGSGDASVPNYFMSESSVRRLVSRLSRMRGAALKIGQFASMQGAKVLPPQIEQIMIRVQNSSHFMPEWQVDEVMSAELGIDWRTRFSEFNVTPINAASIGQVHHGRLHDGRHVAVKVQYPGVAGSIKSDLKNIALILTAGSLLPRGLYLENSIAVLGRELADECDYSREASYGRAFREALKDDPHFTVPAVIDDLCTARVLTTEYLFGESLSKSDQLPQELKDEIGTKILRLCLRELCHFGMMQTDPNWSNFLWNDRTKRIELLDFGACRSYSEAFIADYLALLHAAISRDRQRCIDFSLKMGYLTGDEPEVMIEAHLESMLAVAEPFMPDAPRPFPFGEQNITDRVRAQIPVMLKHRLTPPPTETYSLNRKLSGCFLLCARLAAKVDCVAMLDEVDPRSF